MSRLKENVSTTDIALDIGANKGKYCNIFSEVFGTVHAFEPHPDNIKDLRNVANDKVIINEGVIGDSNGQIELVINRNNPGGHSIRSEFKQNRRYGHSDKTIKVNSITLDEFCLDKNVKFIKCDIEGGEHVIFNYGIQTLSTKDITLLLETHRVFKDKSKDLEDLEKLSLFFRNLDYNIQDTNLNIVNNMIPDSHYVISKSVLKK